MKKRPIIFSEPMVKAILDGRKTQTRRVIIGKHRWLMDPEGFYKTPEERRDHFAEPAAAYHKSKKTWFWYEREYMDEGWHAPFNCPYGEAGDQLYVRENYHFGKAYDKDGAGRGIKASEIHKGARIHYAADGPRPKWAGRGRPNIFMPKWGSRILLQVDKIAVERVQDIDEEGAEAEGDPKRGLIASENTHVDWFHQLWDNINGERGFRWDVNPWVWVVTFRVLETQRKIG